LLHRDRRCRENYHRANAPGSDTECRDRQLITTRGDVFLRNTYEIIIAQIDLLAQIQSNGFHSRFGNDEL
jgi:hypothetical protein